MTLATQGGQTAADPAPDAVEKLLPDVTGQSAGIRRALVTALDSSPRGAEKWVAHIVIAQWWERLQRISELERCIDILRTENARLDKRVGVLEERISSLRGNRFASGVLTTVGGVLVGVSSQSSDLVLRICLALLGVVLVITGGVISWKSPEK